MAKFHINNEGDPGKCSAALGRCPFGDDLHHFSTQKAARRYYEETMADELLSANSKAAKREHQTDLLHNLNYDRQESTNRATIYDGDRLYSIFKSGGIGEVSEGLYESYGTARVDAEGKMEIVPSVVEYIGPDNMAGRERATDQLLYTLRSFPNNYSLRQNMNL